MYALGLREFTRNYNFDVVARSGTERAISHMLQRLDPVLQGSLISLATERHLQRY